MIIDVKNLSFGYGHSKPVLAVDSFQLHDGERLFLHGPSGSGKTTFLGIAAGILKATAGEVTVLGQDFAKLSSHKRDRVRGEHIGYIFQQFNLIPYLSVIENVVLPCRFNAQRRLRIQGKLSDVAQDLCEHLGIGSYVHHPVTELSVGQQQRVAAARALVGSPELIVADEPTSSLDAEHREAFIDLLFQETKRSKAAILFVSHDQSLAKLFDRTVSLAAINRARN